MSDLNEKAEPSVNVLTITRPSPSRQVSSKSPGTLSTIEDVESVHSLTPQHTHSQKEWPNPFEREITSPFYDLENQKTESKQNINFLSTPYDTDVEAGLTPEKSQASCSKVKLTMTCSGDDADRSMWPGEREMKIKKKAMRKAKSKHSVCGCLAGMNKKTRIWIKVLIALIVVGAAIGIGIGISKAVGGGIWQNGNTSNAPIHGSND